MAPTMMKAALLKEYGKPLIIESVPVPKPTGRHVLARVEAASLCHSDLTIIDNAVGVPGKLPLIIGHEAVVVVEELGPEAAKYGIKVGDRIGAPLWQDWCLDCYECKNLGPEFCPGKTMRGVSSPGFFAEYTTMDAATAVVIPRGKQVQLEGGNGGDGDGAGGEEEEEEEEEVTAAQLSPIFCAGITVWDALTRAKLSPGETVAIVGVGGLGEMATKYAHAFGANVIAIDVSDGQLENVKAGGSADQILNTRGLQPAEVKAKIWEMNRGHGVDAAVVTSGSKAAYLTAMSILRPVGRLMVVGIPPEEVPFNAAVVAIQALQIIGGKVPGQIGSAACVEFCQRKGIYPKVNPREFQLEDINEMIDLMRAGKVDEGRMVVRFF